VRFERCRVEAAPRAAGGGVVHVADRGLSQRGGADGSEVGDEGTGKRPFVPPDDPRHPKNKPK